MSIFSMLTRSRNRDEKRKAEMLRCLKQGYAFATSSNVFTVHAMRDPAFDAWRSDSAQVIADCEDAPAPASAHAERLLNEILTDINDPRCDTLTALSLVISRVEESGAGPWPYADRALLLAAVPYGEASHKFLAMEHGSHYDEAQYERIFVLLGAQPSPQAAAVLCAVLYRDLQDEGRHGMAHELGVEVHRRLRRQHTAG